MEKNKRALIVEDSKTIAKIIAKILKKANVDCVHSRSVSSALAFIESPVIVDLFIVDFYLPDGTGETISDAIRKNKNRASIPIIMITGGGDNLVFPSLESGANIVLHKPFDEDEFLMIAKNLMSLSDAYRKLDDIAQIVGSLVSAIEVRDHYTSGHSRRVANLSLEIFRALDLVGEREESSLYYGALLHDVGKIGIPDEILNAERSLTEEEFEMIKKHPRIGFDICSNLNKLRSTLNIILQHHEKIDGSGYPYGIKNSAINSQIVQVADIYDAMTSKRSYREAKSHEDALSIIEKEVEAGKIDKRIYEALIKVTSTEGFVKKLNRLDPYLLR